MVKTVQGLQRRSAIRLSDWGDVWVVHSTLTGYGIGVVHVHDDTNSRINVSRSLKLQRKPCMVPKIQVQVLLEGAWKQRKTWHGLIEAEEGMRCEIYGVDGRRCSSATVLYVSHVPVL